MTDPLPQARPALAPCLAGALRRRLRYAWSRLARGRRRPAVEAALDWLLGQEIAGGLRDPWLSHCQSPPLVGACIETALSYGCWAEAARWGRWLVSVQRADGALPRAVPLDEGFADQRARPDWMTRLFEHYRAPTFESTGWAVRSFLALADDLPELEGPATRACRYLQTWIGGDGTLEAPAEGHQFGPGTSCWPVLPLLPALQRAGERWGVPTCRSAAERALRAFVDRGLQPIFADPGFPEGSTGDLAQQIETLLEMGCGETAYKLTGHVNSRQRRDGSVRESLPSGRLDPVLTLGRTTAHAAALWYRLKHRQRADGAMRYLERRQGRDGSLPGLPRHWIPAWSVRDAWAVKHYLDAALLRVRAAFEDRWREFPDEIDPNDGRMQAVRAWVDAFPAGAKVADVGCGTGRFLEHLAEWFPGTRLTGIDFSEAMLARLPDGVEARAGSLLRIPAADGEFDGALAVESLEHALVPERAVAELCRVVRPGGQVLVIDKHRAKQPLSEHDPWERWFLPEELARWLARHCDDVAVEPVAHSEGRAGSDLFLAARGRRRMDPMD